MTPEVLYLDGVIWGVGIGLLSDFGFLFIAIRGLPKQKGQPSLKELLGAVAWVSGFWAAGGVATPVTANLTGAVQPGAQFLLYFMTVMILFTPCAVGVNLVYFKKFLKLSGVRFP